MMERKLDKEATILYSNETESEVRRMKEKKILKRLSEIVPNLPDSKKERLLGVAEGMNIMKESMENQKAG